MKTFALIGAAGYIAPRHMEAIKNTGNNLLAALDPNDSVGILDTYFPNTAFFTDTALFEQFLHNQKQSGTPVDYVSICSPNYLHAAHIELALRLGANVICEKPLVLNTQELDRLEQVEKETGKRVYTLLQLRYHDTIIGLKKQFQNTTQKHNVQLRYITSRGQWYQQSWKGNHQKSGGPAMNIGIHFFDMLAWIFGSCESASVSMREENKIAGTLQLQHASVEWYLSLDSHDLPKHITDSGKRAYREIIIDETPIEFSEGFTDLHTKVYQETIAGNGFGIQEARAALNIVELLKK